MAALMVRDDAPFLPGLLRNLAPQVDGLVALDDGSTDGGDRLLALNPLVTTLLRNPTERPGWDEPAGLRLLTEAALQNGADWILVVDADERLERDFRERAERVIRRGRRLGFRAFELRVREVWDRPDRWRADGIWGLKRSARLFQARPASTFEDRPWHGAKAPREGRTLGIYPLADLILYHLRMLRPEDRAERRRRYETLDPGARWQPGVGYAYLTDERGLTLRPIPERRGYDE